MQNRLVPFFVANDGLIHFPKTIPFSNPGIASLKLYYQYLDTFPDNTQLLIDWPWAERDNYDFGELNFVPNAFLFAAYKAMEDLEPNQGYSAKASALLKKIRKLFARKGGLYVDNAESSHTAIHSAMWAVTWGIAERNDYSSLAALMKARGMVCSVYGAQFLLDALFIAGAEQVAIDLMRSEEKRSWINMIRCGSTISMEAWDDEFKPTQDWNHAWGAAPANVIPRRLAGIRPIANGFTRFVVDPKPGNLKEFSIIHPTLHGGITLEFTRGAYRLEVPEGTEAVYRKKVLKPGVHTLHS